MSRQKPEIPEPDDAASAVRPARPRVQEPSVADILRGVRDGDRAMLGRAITLVESANPSHYERASDVLRAALPYSGKAVRAGISGVPGVGKSTLIEVLGMHLVSRGHHVAVLAVDPTSERSHGSILGDKTRMDRLATHAHAFIRPSPTSGKKGGVGRATRESIVLCEAAGYDVVLVETVGVGQSETVVRSMVDVFVLLVLTGAGDDLQGIKRGIMELADVIAVTKADGDNVTKARRTRHELEAVLHFYPRSPAGWHPVVLCCSASTGEGIEQLWEAVEQYVAQARTSGYYERNRVQQATDWFRQTVEHRLLESFYRKTTVEVTFSKLNRAVAAGEISPFEAAERLLEACAADDTRPS